jgi:hypothetical protein
MASDLGLCGGHHSGLYIHGLLTIGRSLYKVISVQECTLAAGEGAPASR